MSNQTQMYRWSINTANVYSFMMFTFAGTLASYKNEVSGFVRKDKVGELVAALKGSGKEFKKFRMVTSKRYWANYDLYN